jgi:DNA-binding GntR family transcriptional regulator
MAGTHTVRQSTGQASMGAIAVPPSLSSLVRDRLKAGVISGKFPAGTMLNEASLAAQLSVSRTPVREALKELAVQGLVRFLPQRGVQVRYFTGKDVHDVFEIRAMIESAAVARATLLRDANLVRCLQRNLDRARRAADRVDRATFLAADSEFHRALCQVSGNSRMTAVLDNLQDVVHLMSVEALARPGRMPEVLVEHGDILGALRAHDEDGARAAMVRHLDRSREAVLEGISDDLIATPSVITSIREREAKEQVYSQIDNLTSDLSQ